MKDTLTPGLRHSLVFRVPVTKTVPYLYPEAPEFQEMPEVFATGFMVGLMEWTCLKLLQPHLEEGEGSLGVHIDVSHEAATPPGMSITVEAECVTVEGRRAAFQVEARDEAELIGRGRHERLVVLWDRFAKRMRDKRVPATS